MNMYDFICLNCGEYNNSEYFYFRKKEGKLSCKRCGWIRPPEKDKNAT